MIAIRRPDITIAETSLALDDHSLVGQPWLWAGRPGIALPEGRLGFGWLLERLGTGPGDEVALPDLVWPGLAYAVAERGARPLAYGLQGRSFAPSPDCLRSSMSPATRVVVVPHLFGLPADLPAFREIADSHGALLVESCAWCAEDEFAGEQVGSVGDAALYSFKYDKTLSLSWGGELTMSPELVDRLGTPEFGTLSEDEDRIVAASFVAQQVLTDKRNVGERIVNSLQALSALMEGAAASGAASGRSAAGSEGEPLGVCAAIEILELAGSCRELDEAAALARLTERVREIVPCTEIAARSRLPRCVKDFCKEYLPIGIMRRLETQAPPAWVPSFQRKSLPPGGLGERIVAAQREGLRDGRWTRSRQAIAAIYREGLNPKKMIFPGDSCSPRFWVSFPVALRERGRAWQVAEQAAKKLGAQIEPNLWPWALHTIRDLRHVVRRGAGCEEAAVLVEGLLNLPVHAQVTEDHARSLVKFLNSI